MKKLLMMAALLFVGLQFTAQAAADPVGAEKLVQQQATNLLKKLDSNPKLYQNDPAAFTKLISQEVLPYMDFSTMSRIVLGKYWKQATPAQQKAFTDAFQDLLIRVYSRSWTQYADATIKVLGNSGLDKYGRTDVRVQVQPKGKKAAIIVFGMREQGGTWKIYDVSFENVSIVLSYRNSFANDIERSGIDGLINKVRSMDGHE